MSCSLYYSYITNFPYDEWARANIETLKSTLLYLGAALIGSTVIVFSLILAVLQINITRMPYGLFHQFALNSHLLRNFVLTFLVSTLIIVLPLLTEQKSVQIIITLSFWGVVVILFLFFYSYHKTLELINPLQQLNYIYKKSKREFDIWDKRSKRAKPLFDFKKKTNPNDQTNSSLNDYNFDSSRAAYFQTNNHWSKTTHQSLSDAIFISHRYAENGDHFISAQAMITIIEINKLYVQVKGNTFLANNPYFPEITFDHDGFIQNTLEHFRRSLLRSIAQGDEIQIEIILESLKELIAVYLEIEYPNALDTKTHSNIAATYLTESLREIAPLNKPDLFMKGIRKIGDAVLLYLNIGRAKEIHSLVEIIATYSIVSNKDDRHHPIALTAMEELSKISLALLFAKNPSTKYVYENLHKEISIATKIVWNLPESIFGRKHTYFLSPYYSGANSFLVKFVTLTNTISDPQFSEEDAKNLTHNIEQWSDGLYQTQKDLLLKAIQKRTYFAFDLVHWILKISECLVAISNAPHCSERSKQGLRKHARWLLSVISWIPDEKEDIEFLQSIHLHEDLFKTAMLMEQLNAPDIAYETIDMLIAWTFKVTKHINSSMTITQTVIGIAIYLQSHKNEENFNIIKSTLKKKIEAQNIDPEILKCASRQIVKETQYPSENTYPIDPIGIALKNTDKSKLNVILIELAEILSPTK